MRCTQISAFSFQLTRLGLINCYLVRQPKGDSKTPAFTLLDTGIPGTEDDILAEATRAGAPIEWIALTHAHDDHVGSADALLGKLKTATPLAASERSIPLLQKPPNKEHEPYEGKEESLEFLSGIQSRVTHTLSDGELYGALRVIETPGHMAGHLSFLDERDGTLFAGDALIGVGRLSVTGYSPWYAALPNFATWDKAAAVASVRRLLKYPIKRIACGHGPIYVGGRELLQEALTRASRHR